MSPGEKALRAQRVFVFAGAASPGNEAFVVRCPGGLPPDAAMQAIAADRATPATAFAGGDEEPFPVRFFTARSELSFCGHGSLAAGSVLAAERGVREVKLAVGSAVVTVALDDAGLATLRMDGPPSVREDFDRAAVLARLRIPPEEIDPALPFVIASAGSPKWLVPVRSAASLRAVSPDSTALAKWSVEQGVNGAYVYSCADLPPGVHALARAFNPKTGADEDAATGVAAGPLAWVLRERWAGAPVFVVEQGLRLENLNRLQVRLVGEKGQALLVGGRVTFAPAAPDDANALRRTA